VGNARQPSTLASRDASRAHRGKGCGRTGRICNARKQMKRDLYETVSARIIAELERGAAPWIKPWSATAGQNTPCNAATNRPYSGCNVILLWMAQQAGYRTPRYLTFKQALELGGHVRKGEHGFNTTSIPV